jgi:penicillin-binding protein 1A
MAAASTTGTASITDARPVTGARGATAPPLRVAAPISRRQLLAAGLPFLRSTADRAPGLAPRQRLPLRRIARVAAALLGLFLAWLIVTTPFARALAPAPLESLTIVSADGEPIARRGPIVDEPVELGELPRHVPLAFVAIEDRRFFRHNGVDLRGTVRALWANVRGGGVRQGGSTITQQLARLSALDRDRTAGRKLREMLLALWLEMRLGKAEILERYLSSVYFGDRVYGLRAAARHYFDREPADLTVEQAALLAALVNAPSRLTPTRNPDGAQARARHVVEAMVDAGFLSRREAAALPAPRLDLRPSRDVPGSTYFADWVLSQAEPREREGRAVIETSLDDRLQRLAEAAVARAPARGAQVALVAMRPDGRVVAMVGGRSYARSAFNRATQARRQPGSTFKLFVYLAALRRGATPDSFIDDVPVAVGDWQPENHGGEYLGPMTLREAFARSSNSAAVQLSEWAGRVEVASMARQFGIGDVVVAPSMALGTSSTTLLEMTAAYAAIAGNRFPVRPSWRNDLAGRWERWTAVPGRALDEREWAMMLDLLFASANAGTGRAAALATPTFGKTGTTQDSRDAWFIGFSEGLVAGVWIGHDDNRPLGNVSGGGVPARIWRDFMSRALGRGA